jgi:hypothetical protein
MLTNLTGPWCLPPKSTNPHRGKTCPCTACSERRRLRELRRAPVGTVDRIATATMLRILIAGCR